MIRILGYGERSDNLCYELSICSIVFVNFFLSICYLDYF